MSVIYLSDIKGIYDRIGADHTISYGFKLKLAKGTNEAEVTVYNYSVNEDGYFEYSKEIDGPITWHETKVVEYRDDGEEDDNDSIVNRGALGRASAEVTDLVLRKNNDYGDAWQRHGLAGVLVRLSDKSLRLENLNNKESLVVSENVRDTLRDIAGYALLGLIWMDNNE